MIAIDNEYYYIDIDQITSVISGDDEMKSGEKTESETTDKFDDSGKLISSKVVTYKSIKPREMDSAKYELIMSFINMLLAFEAEDTSLGFENNMSKQPLSVKIAYNTLLNYKILKKY